MLLLLHSNWPAMAAADSSHEPQSHRTHTKPSQSNDHDDQTPTRLPTIALPPQHVFVTRGYLAALMRVNNIAHHHAQTGGGGASAAAGRHLRASGTLMCPAPPRAYVQQGQGVTRAHRPLALLPVGGGGAAAFAHAHDQPPAHVRSLVPKGAQMSRAAGHGLRVWRPLGLPLFPRGFWKIVRMKKSSEQACLCSVCLPLFSSVQYLVLTDAPCVNTIYCCHMPAVSYFFRREFPLCHRPFSVVVFCNFFAALVHTHTHTHQTPRCVHIPP